MARKVTNIIAALCALAISILMLMLSYGSGRGAFFCNAAFFAAMILIVVASLLTGFLRLVKTKEALEHAENGIREAANSEEGVRSVLKSRNLFGLPALDRKFREYAVYSERTDGGGDIEDYVNEDLIGSYSGRAVLDIIPDVLTSLGILGTFIGLVWGLKNFDPVSYETMASSITSLIDGIKVAFATSVMGISLSLAFSFILKKKEQDVLDAYDSFIDSWQLLAAPDKEARLIESISENQEKQTEVMENMLGEIPESTAISVSEHLSPVTKDLNETMEKFVSIVTLNQQELVEIVAETVAETMTRQFASELSGMTRAFTDANESLNESVKNLSGTYKQYENALSMSSKRLAASAREEEVRRKESAAGFKKQQEILTELIDSVNSAMERISEASYEDLNTRIAMEKQVEACQKTADEMEQSVMRIHRESTEFIKSVSEAKTEAMKVEMPEVKELSEKADILIKRLEEDAAERREKKGFFRRTSSAPRPAESEAPKPAQETKAE